MQERAKSKTFTDNKDARFQTKAGISDSGERRPYRSNRHWLKNKARCKKKDRIAAVSPKSDEMF